LQAYEGYIEKGNVFSVGLLPNVLERRRVIITVLDEPMQKKADTWAELDGIIAEMVEKPRIEDFPRVKLGRDLVAFKEA
jgi:hypothetical protein